MPVFDLLGQIRNGIDIDIETGIDDVVFALPTMVGRLWFLRR